MYESRSFEKIEPTWVQTVDVDPDGSLCLDR